MDMLNDFKLSVDVSDILRGQRADPEIIRNRRPALVNAAERAFAREKPLIHPIASVRDMPAIIYSLGSILLDDSARLSGPPVAAQLAGVQRISAVPVTIGAELAEASTRLLKMDPLLALASDGLGNAAIGHIGQQTCHRIGEQAQRTGLAVSTPRSALVERIGRWKLDRHRFFPWSMAAMGESG